MKFGTQTKKNMLSTRNAKPEVCRHFQNWLLPPSWKSLQCCKSAIYHPITKKFGTQTKKNMHTCVGCTVLLTYYNCSLVALFLCNQRSVHFWYPFYTRQCAPSVIFMSLYTVQLSKYNFITERTKTRTPTIWMGQGKVNARCQTTGCMSVEA